MEYKRLSDTAIEYNCPCCDGRFVIKPSTDIPIDLIPIAANEYISYRLLMLLRAKGINICVPSMHLVSSDTNNRINKFNVPAVAIQHIGNTGRLTSETMNYAEMENLIYPDWVYWFDRWIGRLDGNGDNNLLLTTDRRVVAIDFSMAYYWACADEKRVKPIDFMDVPFIQKLKDASSDKVKNVINNLSDKEIHKVIFEDEKKLCPEFISKSTLTAYYTGLCLRKNII